MDIELANEINAPIDKVWTTLLDPQKMAGCVPGVEAVEVVNDREYVIDFKVKIAFIAARFRIRTTVTDMTAPTYLRCESIGEDAAIGSSVRSVAELFLTDPGEERTSLKVKATATVLGKLGALGLAPMRTKAERLFVEFCRNLEAEISGARRPAANEGGMAAAPRAAPAAALAPFPAENDTSVSEAPAAKGGFFGRVSSAFGGTGGGISVELRRGNTVVTLRAPATSTGEVLKWLDRQIGPGQQN